MSHDVDAFGWFEVSENTIERLPERVDAADGAGGVVA